MFVFKLYVYGGPNLMNNSFLNANALTKFLSKPGLEISRRGAGYTQSSLTSRKVLWSINCKSIDISTAQTYILYTHIEAPAVSTMPGLGWYMGSTIPGIGRYFRWYPGSTTLPRPGCYCCRTPEVCAPSKSWETTAPNTWDHDSRWMWMLLPIPNWILRLYCCSWISALEDCGSTRLSRPDSCYPHVLQCLAYCPRV